MSGVGFTFMLIVWLMVETFDWFCRWFTYYLRQTRSGYFIGETMKMLLNKLLQPTRVGALSSASRFTSLDPAWLSFGRSPNSQGHLPSPEA